MNTNDLGRMKTLHDDVLLEYVDQNEVSTSSIISVHDDTEDHYQFYRVVVVGPDCTGVKPGDIVIAHWKRITIPFRIDSKRYGVTSEKEILGVLEDE